MQRRNKRRQEIIIDMGFTIETGVSAAAVFIQGLLSFFSPCVLPLVPLYFGYLAGGVGMDGEGGRLKLLFRVLCITLGISGAFFVLGMLYSRDQWSVFCARPGSFSVGRIFQ